MQSLKGEEAANVDKEMQEEEQTSLDLGQLNNGPTISLSFNNMPKSTNNAASTTSHLSTDTGSTPFVMGSNSAAGCINESSG